MFEKLNNNVGMLNDMHQLKIENGHYPSCRDARYILQQMIAECKQLRKSLTEKAKVRSALSQEQRDKLKADEKLPIVTKSEALGSLNDEIYND